MNEFRRKEAAAGFCRKIKEVAGAGEMTFMEVCGTHTMSIARYGIRELIPDNISLVSGPGCPVCVTPNTIIDKAIALSRFSDVTMTTFGDMMKVPGTESSLEIERMKGRDIRIVTSTLEALALARKHPERRIVFVGIGFETTAPTVAMSILAAQKEELKNYYVLCAHKTMPQAMLALSRGDVPIDGYLCPGHVSAVIGTKSYETLVAETGIGCVVSGFEPLDILQALYMLVQQVDSGKPQVENQYRRVVPQEGNPAALAVIKRVFEETDSVWRGLGKISKSGLKIRNEFSAFDAEVAIPVQIGESEEPFGCRCGEVLQGKIKPNVCALFGQTCHPDHPVGACMVSSEGTCAAYYKYLRYHEE